MGLASPVPARALGKPTLVLIGVSGSSGLEVLGNSGSGLKMLGNICDSNGLEGLGASLLVAGLAYSSILTSEHGFLLVSTNLCSLVGRRSWTTR